MAEDDGTVVAAYVRPLPVELRGVVAVPEYLEQFLVGDMIGIEGDLNHLGMTGSVGADLFIRRLLLHSPHVSDRRRYDPGYCPESLLHMPETSGAERCFFHGKPPSRLSSRLRFGH